jgi:hypothetical protein
MNYPSLLCCAVDVVVVLDTQFTMPATEIQGQEASGSPLKVLITGFGVSIPRVVSHRCPHGPCMLPPSSASR